VARFDLASGKMQGAPVRASGSIYAVAQRGADLVIGGSAHGDKASVSCKGTNVSRQIKLTTPATSHAFLARVDPASCDVDPLWVLDGAGESAVSSIALLGDELIVCGALGGFGAGLTGVFDLGKASEKTLTSVSADDDPASDYFLARLRTDLSLGWARLIAAYENTLQERPCPLALWNSTIALSVTKQGYKLRASLGEPDQQDHEDAGLLFYALDGKIAHFIPLPVLARLVPQGDRLLVYGQSRTGFTVGKQTLPDARIQGATALPFQLRLDSTYAAASLRWGGWSAPVPGYAHVQVWRHPAPPDSVLLIADTLDQLALEPGTPAEQTFGSAQTRELLVLRWPCKHP